MSAVAAGPGANSVEWSTWGTYVHLAVGDAPGLLSKAAETTRALLDVVDRACSRFRADSDLSRANRSPGRWVQVDPILACATSVALHAAELTGGLVSPCLGRTLVALGYDVDLGELRRRAAAPARRLPPPTPDAWREVGVRADAVRVPPGCELDLGATAKAWAADVVAGTLVERFGCRVLISLGGDLRVQGPDGPPWTVHVTERREDTHGQLVDVSNGGVATSTTLVRRWQGTDGELHHLIDPRTNLPVSGPVRTVTAAGTSCTAANIATTAALVLGAEAGPWLEAQDVSARLVLEDGSVQVTGAWPHERVGV